MMKKEIRMKANFVTFFSPGTFVNEESTMPIKYWDTDEALKIARGVTERYNAKPFGFQFFTKERGENDLDSKVTEKSHMYYIGGIIKNKSDVAKEYGEDSVLYQNMVCNKFDRIVENNNSWKVVQRLLKGDVVLDVKL